jgi:hypothetical protein
MCPQFSGTEVQQPDKRTFFATEHSSERVNRLL